MGLRIECKNRNRSKNNVYQLIKRDLRFRGTKESVLRQLEEYTDFHRRQLHLDLGDE